MTLWSEVTALILLPQLLAFRQGQGFDGLIVKCALELVYEERLHLGGAREIRLGH